MSDTTKFTEITNTLASNDVVLFMKGTSVFPQCGFSAVVVNILTNLDINFKSINILEDDELRQAIKEFSDWPTIPQLYIKSEFIGGCDIVKDMFSSGELQDLFKSKGIKIKDAA